MVCSCSPRNGQWRLAAVDRGGHGEGRRTRRRERVQEGEAQLLEQCISGETIAEAGVTEGVRRDRVAVGDEGGRASDDAGPQHEAPRAERGHFIEGDQQARGGGVAEAEDERGRVDVGEAVRGVDELDRQRCGALDVIGDAGGDGGRDVGAEVEIDAGVAHRRVTGGRRGLGGRTGRWIAGRGARAGARGGGGARVIARGGGVVYAGEQATGREGAGDGGSMHVQAPTILYGIARPGRKQRRWSGAQPRTDGAHVGESPVWRLRQPGTASRSPGGR